MEKFIEECKTNGSYDVRDTFKKGAKERRLLIQKVQGANKTFKCYGKQQICKTHSTEQFLIRISETNFFDKDVDDKYIWFPKDCNVCWCDRYSH